MSTLRAKRKQNMNAVITITIYSVLQTLGKLISNQNN